MMDLCRHRGYIEDILLQHGEEVEVEEEEEEGEETCQSEAHISF